MSARKLSVWPTTGATRTSGACHRKFKLRQSTSTRCFEVFRPFLPHSLWSSGCSFIPVSSRDVAFIGSSVRFHRIRHGTTHSPFITLRTAHSESSTATQGSKSNQVRMPSHFDCAIAHAGGSRGYRMLRSSCKVSLPNIQKRPRESLSADLACSLHHLFSLRLPVPLRSSAFPCC